MIGLLTYQREWFINKCNTENVRILWKWDEKEWTDIAHFPYDKFEIYREYSSLNTILDFFLNILNFSVGGSRVSGPLLSIKKPDESLKKKIRCTKFESYRIILTRVGQTDRRSETVQNFFVLNV